MRRWQVRQTCNMVEPPAYSRSGQTWAEVCRACLPPFPDCSHSPPCRTHDSAPVLSYHKIDSQINYTGEESLPPPPPPQVWELPLREGHTWVRQSSAPFQGSHRSPGRRICQNWKKRQFQFTKITTTVLFCFLTLDTTNQCAIAPVIVGVWWPDKISFWQTLDKLKCNHFFKKKINLF